MDDRFDFLKDDRTGRFVRWRIVAFVLSLLLVGYATWGTRSPLEVMADDVIEIIQHRDATCRCHDCIEERR